MCWLWHWRHSTSPLIESLFYSDEFSWVSFADEHFEQPQFGFDVLVFVVLHSQWGAVLLLHVPSVLSKKLVLKLFQVLANPLLLLSRLLELFYKFLPVGWGEFFFKCLTLKYTRTSSIKKKTTKNFGSVFAFLYYRGHTGGRQPVSKQMQSDLDWLQLLCNTMAKVCKQPLADKQLQLIWMGVRSWV